MMGEATRIVETVMMRNPDRRGMLRLLLMAPALPMLRAGYQKQKQESGAVRLVPSDGAFHVYPGGRIQDALDRGLPLLRRKRRLRQFLGAELLLGKALAHLAVILHQGHPDA